LNDILSIAIALFLIANPIGNTPAILAVVRSFSFEDQKRIIFRESILALGLALFFQFFGEVFFKLLNIENWAIGYCGGTLLLLVALKMIFTTPESEDIPEAAKQEPFFVPIATPIISGPGLLTMIMIYSSQEQNNFKMAFAILIAWIGVIAVMMGGPYLQKVLKRRGLIALEQLMGMILAFMAVDMAVNATIQFMRQL
jgi:multiple antibiotic resistance protein